MWVGRDRKEPIGRNMTGARAAQPLWNEFMSAYLETVDETVRAEDFPIPSGVVFTPVDLRTGERAIPHCSYHGEVVLEAFLDGTEPDPQECGELPPNLSELPWPFQLAFYSAWPGEPMPTPEAVEIADRRIRKEDKDGFADDLTVNDVTRAAFGNIAERGGLRGQPRPAAGTPSSIR